MIPTKEQIQDPTIVLPSEPVIETSEPVIELPAEPETGLLPDPETDVVNELIVEVLAIVIEELR